MVAELTVPACIWATQFLNPVESRAAVQILLVDSGDDVGVVLHAGGDAVGHVAYK
jgi:hypothetical protein